MSEPFTTRAQAAFPSAELVELMAKSGYEAYRSRAPSFPPWEQCVDAFSDAAKAEMRAALVAARNAGWSIEKP